MKIQSKIIKFQMFINIAILLLAINLIVGHYLTGNIYKYGSLIFFLLLMFTLLFFFRKDEVEETVTINKKYMTFTKYNVYLFVVVFAVFSFTMGENLFDLKGLIYLPILFLTSIFGIVYNAMMFYKTKKRD